MLWIPDDGHSRWPERVGAQKSKPCAVVGNNICVYCGGN